MDKERRRELTDQPSSLFPSNRAAKQGAYSRKEYFSPLSLPFNFRLTKY
jgi:hypothetical protein